MFFQRASIVVFQPLTSFLPQGISNEILETGCGTQWNDSHSIDTCGCSPEWYQLEAQHAEIHSPVGRVQENLLLPLTKT